MTIAIPAVNVAWLVPLEGNMVLPATVCLRCHHGSVPESDVRMAVESEI